MTTRKIALQTAILFSLCLTSLAQTTAPVVVTQVYSPYSGGLSGQMRNIALGQDGFARFIVDDWDENSSSLVIDLVRCLDADCNTHNVTVAASGFRDGALTIGDDGFPRIVAVDSQERLHFIQCTDSDCATSVQTTPLLSPDEECNTGSPDYTPILGRYCAAGNVNLVLIGSNGLPQILFDWQDNYDQDTSLSVASCDDASCTTATVATVAQAINEDVISGSMVLGLDGYPRIVYVDEQAPGLESGPLHFVQCTSATCGAETDSNIGTAQSGFSVDVAVGSDGFGRVAFEDPNRQAGFIQCTNADCSSKNETSNLAQLGAFSPLYIGIDREGNPEIAVADDVEYISCTTADCSSYNLEQMPESLTDDGMGMTMGVDGLALMVAQDPEGSVDHVRSLGKLSCTSPVTRGGATTCRVTGPSGPTVSDWKFVDQGDNTVTRSANTTSLTWSGVVVTSGTVSVTVSGITNPLTANLTANPRTNFAFTAAQPQKEGNPYTCVSAGGSEVIEVNNPPQSQNSSDAIGKYCDIEDASYEPASISDAGPNNGYSYVLSATNNASLHWIIAPDAENSSSDFYQAQCGNYNSSTNTGFISGAQLDANTVRHESGTVQGHYGNYVTAQSNSNNNVGTGLESAVNFSSGTTFQNWVKSYIAPRMTVLHNETRSPEPYDVNHDQNGVYDGPINFLPYAPCQ